MDAAQRKRVRDWGLTVGRLPTGTYNAITDVLGVKVGHATVMSGTPQPGHGAAVARTGVTVVVPQDDVYTNRVFAGASVINGAGELTGMAQVLEWGTLETPIALTSSHSVGLVTDGIVEHMVARYPVLRQAGEVVLPVVGECNDGFLNDTAGRHVKQHHVREALNNAQGGRILEGAVGGGTGMVCFEFKGGIGTSSRVTPHEYTVGALVMSNFGSRQDLTMFGAPVGRELTDLMPAGFAEGSIIIVLATDAPLLPHQLNRVARRATYGLARVGGYGHHGSGELAIAFSTANTVPQSAKHSAAVSHYAMLNDDLLNEIFLATVECVEESVLNSLFMANTTEGQRGIVHALPVQRVVDILQRKDGIRM